MTTRYKIEVCKDDIWVCMHESTEDESFIDVCMRADNIADSTKLSVRVVKVSIEENVVDTFNCKSGEGS